MKDSMGSPGTRSSLALQLSQFLCAVASIVAMESAYSVSTNNFKAFWYMIIAMIMLCCWSFLLACFDLYSLKTKADIQTPGLVWALVVGDWIMAINAFAAASASAGVAVFFARDTRCCTIMVMKVCTQYNLSVILGFMSWSFVAVSALSMFKLLVSIT